MLNRVVMLSVLLISCVWVTACSIWAFEAILIAVRVVVEEWYMFLNKVVADGVLNLMPCVAFGYVRQRENDGEWKPTEP